MSRGRTGAPRAETTPLGAELRLLAVSYKSSGKGDHALGLAQAADLVDEKAHLLTGRAFVDALEDMLGRVLESFTADVVAALRDAGSTPPPAPTRTSRKRTETPLLAGEPSPEQLVGLGLHPGAHKAVRDHMAKSPAETASRSYVEALPDPDAPNGSDGSQGVRKGVRTILGAVVQHMPAGVSAVQLTALTGYKKSTRDFYVQQGGRAGWIERKGKRIVATDAGVAEAERSGVKALPTGAALFNYWMEYRGRNALREGERRVLALLVKFYPHPVSRERIGEHTGYRKSTRDLYVQRLERRKLLAVTGIGHVVASETLFDPPRAAGGRPS